MTLSVVIISYSNSLANLVLSSLSLHCHLYELSLLFSNKKFSLSEIKSYYKERNNAVELAYKIDRALSVYVEIIDPVVDNYIIPWLNKGYDEDSLLFIANYCFRKNKRTLEDMNEVVEKAYKSGLVTIMGQREPENMA